MLKSWWLKVKNWFRHSETIAWARLQILFGIVWGVVSTLDMTPYLDGYWLLLWFIFNGVVTELLRRKNTVVVTEQAPLTGEPVTVLRSASAPSAMGTATASGDAGTTASELNPNA